ncbi:unnamed protein product [Blepharisma stoltei]|uniref:Uncharacterized protein n=1 Tax=Blepharisma stoltei TaxID=1481888 RepID=A0AAU9I6L7_9CILI|nr:unnamed protein product [Blepharisma stoltei]
MAFEEAEGFSEILKIVLIGAANVGKTALVYRYVLNELPVALTSTIGVEFTKRVVTSISTGQKVQLHIWDTAGQERFKSVTKHYYRGADACIIVYDISNKESFEEVPNWLAELKDNTPEECIVCLLGNKMDLEATNHRRVSREEAMRYANAHGLVYHETSAFWDREVQMNPDKIVGGIEKIFDKTIGNALGRHSLKDEPKELLKPSGKGVKLDLQQLYTYHSDNRCGC